MPRRRVGEVILERDEDFGVKVACDDTIWGRGDEKYFCSALQNSRSAPVVVGLVARFSTAAEELWRRNGEGWRMVNGE